MNKELIELQRNCTSVAVVILEDYYKDLGRVLFMDASINDKYLFSGSLGNPIFKNQLDNLSKNGELTYFVIKGISEIDEELQNRYIGLVKDREFLGYNLPNNVIIVFTVNKKEDLQKISKDLYHFCIVAF